MKDIILMRDWSFQDQMTVGIFRSNEGLVIPISNDSCNISGFSKI